MRDPSSTGVGRACDAHAGTRRVALVAAHFPPSNLAGVHRARLLAQHLEEFGWKPAIVTTHHRHYEEALDWDLAALVNPKLEVLATPALPTKPLRLVGDIGVRGLPWHLSALTTLVRSRAVDFVHITVPSFYSALLGQLLYRKSPLPFGIDYIDPWVHTWPEADVRYSKAWCSMKLSQMLEPWAVRNASLITGVAAGYFEGVLERNPHLRESAEIAAMPYGNSVRDFEAVVEMNKPPYLFDKNDGCFHMLYAGAMLPKGYSVAEAFFAALRRMKTTHPMAYQRFRVHFVGTGKSPNDKSGFNILPLARKFDVEEAVTEHPHRAPYVDVLSHLTHASGILILGSTEAHYTPSKVFQAIQAKRPIFALLHRDSTAVDVIEHCRAGVAIAHAKDSLPDPSDLAQRLADFVSADIYDPDDIRWEVLESYSARASARILATALDAAMARFSERMSVRA